MYTKNRQIRVALVEDSFLARISLKHSLSLLKNIKIASDFDNCEELINSLKKTKVDTILMDLDLNGMNGIEATCYIKKKYPKIKVIVVTCHKSKDIFTASMFSGADAFVIKNLNADILGKIIEVVDCGALWVDPVVLNLYREIFPKPDSLDLAHLYNNNAPNFDLTVRELEVLKLLAQGKSNPEIAKEIIVSANTAKAHVGNILNKMNATDRVQAAVKAVRAHII